MLQVSMSSRPATPPPTLLQRVSDAIDLLGCENVRVCSSGPHVLLGVLEREPYARLTPLGDASYGLAFRAMGAQSTHHSAWEPLLLVDDLMSVIEHALVAVDVVGETPESSERAGLPM